MNQADFSPVSRYFGWISLAIILAYMLRVTIPALWIYPIAPTIVELSGFVFLLIALTGLFFDSKMKLLPVALLLIMSVVISTILSINFETALIRSLLWMGVFIAVGPVIMGHRASIFRNHLWNHSILIIYLVVTLSFVWNMLGLPIYGKGAAGITVHCMLLGALAGISTILSFHALWTHSFRSLIYWFIFVSSFLTCMLSGSRSALMAAVVGCAFIFVSRLGNAINRIIMITLVLLTAAVSWFFLDIGNSDEENFNEASLGVLAPFASEIVMKGSSNSRETLWINRVAEIEESPVVGIGLGVELYKKANTEHLETNTIEPGSSYLAVLSMTGFMGGLSLLLLITSLVAKMKKNSRVFFKNDAVQVIGVGTFWAIHGIAEGWIFAGGSILCLFFWIWVGRLAHFYSPPFVRTADL